MTPEIQAILAASDHQTACEAPPGFDRERAIQRVQALVPALRRISGVELTLEERIEDASFFCDVACYREESPRLRYPVILIRFSAFGQLVTVTWSEGAEELEGAIAGLIAALGDAGFTYVPAAELEEPYTGRNPHLGSHTWWYRFFDYL